MIFARPAPTLLGAVALAALACQASAQESAGVTGTSDDALPRVVLDTNRGAIEIELRPDRAPGTVDNFLEAVDAGFYDGTVFHRVIEGFMIQGGGFDASLERKETGAPIRNEADNGLGNRRYTIAMARTNAPHSATSQFFINVADNRNLDHTAPTPRGWGYAVFGEVVDGRDVVDAIAEVPTGPRGPFGGDVPTEPVVIERAARASPPGEPVPDGAGAGGTSADASGAAPERDLPGMPASGSAAEAN